MKTTPPRPAFNVNGLATISIERLHSLLNYNPETGALFWKIKRGNMAAGDQVLTQDDKGYIKVGIDGRRFAAHRVVWALANGQWPNGDIDHINGTPSDNRLSNLRDVSHAINQQNRRLPEKGNTTGVQGVVFDKSRNKWRAKLTLNRSSIHLGRYDTAAEAKSAYLDGKRKHHEGCTI